MKINKNNQFIVDNRVRNCKTLEIPHDFCICKQKILNIENPNKHIRSLLGANYLVDQLNLIINQSIDDRYRCEHLMFKSILKSKIIYRQSRQFYKISLVVSPSDGEFEAIIRPVVDKSISDGNQDRFQLASTRIDRLNEYGNQGDCSTDERIRPICFCKQMYASMRTLDLNISSLI
jgi:hypothetical protein